MLVFEYGPIRHYYKNKNPRVLVALGSTLRRGIPPNGNRTFGAGVLRNEGASAWNQRRLEKLGAWHRASSERIDNVMFQQRVCKHLGLAGALPLLMCSGLTAQSNRASIPGQTKHAILDNSIDELQQISTPIQMLSKRVSAGVIQIFSTGYTSSEEREHRNTDLLSRGLTSGSGIIIGSDGSVVTNAQVVQVGRRIRIRVNQAAMLPAQQNGETRLVFDANLVVADRDTDLAPLTREIVGGR